MSSKCHHRVDVNIYTSTWKQDANIRARCTQRDGDTSKSQNPRDELAPQSLLLRYCDAQERLGRQHRGEPSLGQA